MSRADWAVYDYVRAGIEAKCRLARVEEERVQLKLHACRMAHWLMRQTDVLLKREFSIPNRIFSAKVIHRYRVVQSLLEMQGNILSPDDRLSLTQLKARIIEAIDPLNVAVIWLPAAEAAPAMEEEGEAESEYSENDADELDPVNPEDAGIEEAMARLEMQEAVAAALDAVLAPAEIREDADDQAALHVEDIEAMVIDDELQMA
jgi:hypothetical protein